MVSEDSQEVRRLPVIHRLRYRGDLSQPGEGQVMTYLHHLNDRCELLEVLRLGGLKSVLPKERNDPLEEV